MLSIKKLNHTYSNGVNALQNINLSINNGMFGLLGPNGAGKSTLMRTIATLQSPASGSILFDGNNIIQQPEKLRQVLGYLPQDFGVYPSGSALELLDHIAVLKGIVEPRVRKRMIEGLLVETNLYHERKRNELGPSRLCSAQGQYTPKYIPKGAKNKLIDSAAKPPKNRPDK